MGRVPRKRRITAATALHWAAAAFLWIVFSVQLQAQANVALRLDSSFLETGEAFVLHIETNLHQPDSLDWSAWDSIVPRQNLLGQSDWEKSGSVWKKDLRLILFDANDSLLLPPIAVVDKNGERAYSDPLPLEVSATPIPSTELVDMQDIKGIYLEEKNWTDYLWMAWIFGGLGVLALLGYWWRQRKTVARQALHRQKAMSARELALKKLDQLEARQLWQQGEVAAYYTALSQIVRAYLDDTFGTATHKTGAEDALNQVQHLPLDQPTQFALGQLLRTADLAKYAKGQPETQYHHQAILDARQIVTSTTVGVPAETA